MALLSNKLKVLWNYIYVIVNKPLYYMMLIHKLHIIYLFEICGLSLFIVASKALVVQNSNHIIMKYSQILAIFNFFLNVYLTSIDIDPLYFLNNVPTHSFFLNFLYKFAGRHLHFYDVVDSVKAEVQKIKSEVDILIGVGHYGYGNDKKLADAVPDLDIIVGGHTHTFLYNMAGNRLFRIVCKN